LRPSLVGSLGDESSEFVVVEEPNERFGARIDLGSLGAHPDAFLVTLVREVADGVEDAPEPCVAIHHGFIL
jgi:hypothetical protein